MAVTTNKIVLTGKEGTSLLGQAFRQSYKILGENDEEIFKGYLYFEENDISDDQIIKIIESHIDMRGGINNIPKLTDFCEFLRKAIVNCILCEDDMWFITWDEIDYPELLYIAEDEIDKFDLYNYIEIDFDTNNYDAVTVFGGICGVVNFAGINLWYI